MGNIQKWGSYEQAAVEQENKELSAGRSAYMKFKVGENVIRFLPPPIGSGTPFVAQSQHFFDKPDGSTVSFACPRVHGGRFCPLCAKAEEFKASRNRADRDRAFRLFPSPRLVASVLDRGEGNELKIVAVGKSIKAGLDVIRNSKRGGGDYTHPITGFDIIVNRKGTGKNDTEYTVFADRVASRLLPTDEEIDALLANRPDLTAETIPPEDDQIEELLGISYAEEFGRSAAPAAARLPATSARTPDQVFPAQARAHEAARAVRTVQDAAFGDDVDDEIPF